MADFIGVVALSVSAVVPVGAARLVLGVIMRILAKPHAGGDSGQPLG